MDRRVDCVTLEKGSMYDDCRSIKKVGYELRDGIYERAPEFIGRRIEDGEGFYIETENENVYLKAVARDDSDDEDNGDDDDDEDKGDDDDDEDEELYVRALDEDSSDDPLLQLDRCE